MKVICFVLSGIARAVIDKRLRLDHLPPGYIADVARMFQLYEESNGQFDSCDALLGGRCWPWSCVACELSYQGLPCPKKEELIPQEFWRTCDVHKWWSEPLGRHVCRLLHRDTYETVPPERLAPKTHSAFESKQVIVNDDRFWQDIVFETRVFVAVLFLQSIGYWVVFTCL
ncbi:MAG: uncharacterized protein KVP18_000120 [Porospora cf. gigantea A]|uniref:uncharacterized protein n=1 Tax=Porospora cf. gigantea A TaxID=2853593 RepID=UPI003559E58C|nr:MAG: hypothetical protein KVP18_000120 [Porospora cf. gigantea A]